MKLKMDLHVITWAHVICSKILTHQNNMNRDETIMAYFRDRN